MVFEEFDVNKDIKVNKDLKLILIKIKDEDFLPEKLNDLPSQIEVGGETYHVDYIHEDFWELTTTMTE